MKIIFASENEEKISGIKKVFPKAEIKTMKANSLIGPAANNSGLFNAVYNKIELSVLKSLNGEEWDAIIALKSGFCELISREREKDNRYFITDVCAILDSNGYRFANGPMYEISRNIYEAALRDNAILERINSLKKGDIEKSIIDYISQGLVTRSYATRVAVEKTLNSEYQDLPDGKLDFSSIITFQNDNIKALEKRCFEETLIYLNSEPEI